MEEKERYKVSNSIEFTVKDNINKEFLNYKRVIDTLNQQDKKIKELENKHLLSENEYQSYCSFKRIEPEIKGCLDREKNLEKEIQQLKQQLTKKEEQLKEELIEKKGLERALSACNRQNDEFADIIKKLVNEKKELKQQLAEKEKERHEEWKTGKEWKWEWQRVNRQLEQANQDKISFAVEQLEKAKEKILSYEEIYYQFLESGAKVPVVCLENFRVKQTIDNQINELKGKVEDV